MGMRLTGFDYSRPYYERFCAEGRMLFLSLYPAMEREPTRQELYRRCHEMGDIVAAGLAKEGGSSRTLSGGGSSSTLSAKSSATTAGNLPATTV